MIPEVINIEPNTQEHKFKENTLLDYSGLIIHRRHLAHLKNRLET